MLNAELLALLVCPQTHQDVALANTKDLAQINEAIRQGQMRNAGGSVVDQPLEGALIRADRAIAYPIREGIPVMLVAEGLSIAQINLNGRV